MLAKHGPKPYKNYKYSQATSHETEMTILENSLMIFWILRIMTTMMIKRMANKKETVNKGQIPYPLHLNWCVLTTYRRNQMAWKAVSCWSWATSLDFWTSMYFWTCISVGPSLPYYYMATTIPPILLYFIHIFAVVNFLIIICVRCTHLF